MKVIHEYTCVEHPRRLKIHIESYWRPWPFALVTFREVFWLVAPALCTPPSTKWRRSIDITTSFPAKYWCPESSAISHQIHFDRHCLLSRTVSLSIWCCTLSGTDRVQFHCPSAVISELCMPSTVLYSAFPAPTGRPWVRSLSSAAGWRGYSRHQRQRRPARPFTWKTQQFYVCVETRSRPSANEDIWSLAISTQEEGTLLVSGETAAL